MSVRRVALGVLAIVAAGCAAAAPAPTSAVPVLRPEVLAEMPHDPDAFTQGLELAPEGSLAGPSSGTPTLYEGTGLEGRSQLRELDAASGALIRAVPLPGRLFGEGITVVGDRIWQLTWRDGLALEWDRASFRLLRQAPIEGEGWGLCRDGGRLVRSDGTPTLRFHDPATFAETGRVRVTLDGAPVTALNELECVDGQVWANLYETDRIVRLDPADGRVDIVVDATGLLEPARRGRAGVLNGIAAAGEGEFLLTGKLWPVMFRVRFVP
jgi:glutamine cyclotransferase